MTAKTVRSERLTTRVLFSGPEDGTPVLFLHGNLSSATWWEEVMVSLPAGFRAIAPDQRGYGEADPDKKIDATRGLADLADDAAALLDALGISQAHVVGHSLGGSVGWHLLRAYPERLLSLTQVAPGSPYGYGGTKDVDGTPCYDDFAGSGAGLVNPEMVKQIQAGARGVESPFTARSVLRSLIIKPPLILEREDAIVESMLSIHLGERDYPGDAQPSPNWPYQAPGVWGPNNGLSPKYVGDVDELIRVSPKPPILWVRGSDDLIISDASMTDAGNLGRLGLIPGWPGEEVYPPQPMLAQTRAVLERYAQAGGRFHEVVMEGVGHSPYLERLEEFNQHFHAFLF
ncbi:MAG: alpha/beta hydrolase [Caldilineae bacterium]|nr:MAG: alpha/beta hydrolase [Caldilineae bacterium]